MAGIWILVNSAHATRRRVSPDTGGDRETRKNLCEDWLYKPRMAGGELIEKRQVHAGVGCAHTHRARLRRNRDIAYPGVVWRWSGDDGRLFREVVRASSGISLSRPRHPRLRNFRLQYLMELFLNWTLCLTSVEDRFAPRSRVCGCLDFGNLG
jgi:hypothetical protein